MTTQISNGVADLEKIKTGFKTAITNAKNLDEVEALRIEYLGRKDGALTLILRNLKNLPESERKRAGEEANRLRLEIEKGLEQKSQEIKKSTGSLLLQKEWLDVTRPGKKPEKGHLHPITKIIRECTDIFASMGFETVEGPEIETEYYSFDALNMPANHPARDMWDTFWLKTRTDADKNADRRGKLLRESASSPRSSALLLRPHTSPVQIRYMEKHNPPIRVISPGRTYRYEATDASHNIQFYQFEGLMVDKNISIANFKAIIQEFFSRLFGAKTQIRLRPSYFPFTEPSFETDITCVACERGLTRTKTRTDAENKCSVCKGSGWLELGGAGMVHPKVFEAVGYNPKNIQGFAFGMGIDRIAMMKYKIPDIRLFHSGDLRFLKQF